MVKRIVFGLIVLFAVSGCSIFERDEKIRTVIETQTVEVPVPVEREIPEELQEPLQVKSPQFVSPDHKDAVVGLTREGVEDFQEMTFQLHLRVRTWESFWQEIEKEKGPNR